MTEAARAVGRSSRAAKAAEFKQTSLNVKSVKRTRATNFLGRFAATFLEAPSPTASKAAKPVPKALKAA